MVLYEYEEEQRTDGEPFCFTHCTSRSWFGIRIATTAVAKIAVEDPR